MANNIDISISQIVKTLQLNVFLIVRHCRQQWGKGGGGANTSLHFHIIDIGLCDD